MNYIGTGRLGLTQSVGFTGTAGTLTNGVSQGVQKIRVVCTSDAFVFISDGSAATTGNGTFMPAGSVEYFTVNPGQKVSAIQSSAGGTVYVTEIV